MSPHDGTDPERRAAAHGPVMRALMLAAALLCLALGIVGIFVPGLPTTVFILMAAWCASRGSPRLSAWLERHRLFGPMIRDWRTHRAVSRRVKWRASAVMALCAAVLFVAVRDWRIAGLGTAAMAAVAVWLWLRPEPA
ncbi:YbaN family protein [Pigmentiphaga soli]|uniref:YbaN family protein n=1 Tax=Pigmentiphaga soli TaxID=1007095 RepID=A0ABP8GZB7_9BURK